MMLAVFQKLRSPIALMVSMVAKYEQEEQRAKGSIWSPAALMRDASNSDAVLKRRTKWNADHLHLSDDRIRGNNTVIL